MKFFIEPPYPIGSWHLILFQAARRQWNTMEHQLAAVVICGVQQIRLNKVEAATLMIDSGADGSISSVRSAATSCTASRDQCRCPLWFTLKHADWQLSTDMYKGFHANASIKHTSQLSDS